MKNILELKLHSLICALVFLTFLPLSRSTEGNLTIGLILPYKITTGGVRSRPGEYYAAAMTIAVDNINNDPTLLSGIKLSFIWAESECDEEKSIDALIRQQEKGVDAFIGFGCKCFTQARVAAALNLPIISHVSTGLTDDLKLKCEMCCSCRFFQRSTEQ